MRFKCAVVVSIATWASACLFATVSSSPALAVSCPASSITNGSTADATQVMAWLNCKAPSENPTFTGNVGIRITSPTVPLEVGGYGGMLKLNSVNTDAEIQLFTTSHQSYIGDYLNGMYFYSNSASVPTMVLSPGAPGKVGIGTTSPNYQLDVSGSNSMLRLNSSSVYSEIQLANTSHVSYIGDYASGLNFFSNNNAVPTMVIAPGAPGKVGIGTTSPGQKLDVAGTIRQSNCTTAGTLSTNASGDIICTSDARLKNIIGPYKSGLDAIERIEPSRFTYKPTASNPVEIFVHAGFIAQNVKEVIPEAVALQRSGFYSLDTTAVLAAAVNAIKELKAQNDAQASEIRHLRDQQNAKLMRLELTISMLQKRAGTQTAASDPATKVMARLQRQP